MPHAGWFFCTPETSFGRAVLQRLLERVTGPPAANKNSFFGRGRVFKSAVRDAHHPPRSVTHNDFALKF
jgi:hypothetical protein